MTHFSRLAILLSLLLASCCGRALEQSNPSILIDGQPPDTCVLSPGQSVQAGYAAENIPADTLVHWSANGPGAVSPADGPTTTLSIQPSAPEGASLTLNAAFSSCGVTKIIQRACLVKGNAVAPAAAPTAQPAPTTAETPVPTPPAAAGAGCLCAKEDTPATFRCLMDMEARAADTADLELITRIFAPGAAIYRGDTNQFYDVARSYYIQEFEAYWHSNTSHFEAAPAGIRGREVYWISGSRTDVTPKSGSDQGQTVRRTNEPPSDHWVFTLDDHACWVVQQLEINAAHLTFPPPQQP